MSVKKRIVSILFFVFLVVGSQNCANNSFSSTGSSSDSSDSTPTEKVSQTFSSASSQRPIDMVWVLDNSASMTDSVATIRANFGNFIATLSGDVDLNIALISRSTAVSYDTHLSLSDYTSSGTQISFMVHSFNPMLVAAASTCPAVIDSDDVFCAAVSTNSRYENIYGSLNGFFRTGSQKVFVFVTDDNSSSEQSTTLQFDSTTGTGIDVVNAGFLYENTDYITASTFIDRMTRSFGSSSSFTAFGFLGLGSSVSPCQARKGAVYISLVESSGGDSFNICDSDWSENFSALKSSVVDYATSTYTVSDSNFIAVESVSLNGTLLTLDEDYSVDGNVVTLSSALISSVGDYSVAIEYTRSI